MSVPVAGSEECCAGEFSWLFNKKPDSQWREQGGAPSLTSPRRAHCSLEQGHSAQGLLRWVLHD